MKKLVLLLLLLTFSLPTWAAKRWLDLSWGIIDQAESYEIEVYQVNQKGERELYLTEKIKENKWSKEVAPGKYVFRLRGYDKRNVAGEWSDFNLLDVRLPKPIYINPLTNDILEGVEEFEEEIKFEWKRVEGAQIYFVEVWDTKDYKFSEYTKESLFNHKLKVGQRYYWRVVALVDKTDEIPDREGTGVGFFLKGKALEVPTLSHKVENNQLTLSWNMPRYATEYDYQMIKLGLNQKWAIWDSNEYYLKNELTFNLPDIQGEFRFNLRSRGGGRSDSPYAFMEFKVQGNEVQVFSVKTQKDNHFKKGNPFFYSLGAEMTFLDYAGESRERDTMVETTFKGQKYFLEGSYQEFFSLWKHRLGLYYTEITNLDYKAKLSEFHYLIGQTRNFWGQPVELSFGAFYMDDLFIDADRFTSEIEFKKVSSAGPMFRIYPYFILNRSFDLGLEVKLYVHTTGLEVPNKEDLNTSLSQDVKLHLTYKIRDYETYSLFVGYYNHYISNKASTAGDSIALEGSANTANSQGFSVGFRLNKFF